MTHLVTAKEMAKRLGVCPGTLKKHYGHLGVLVGKRFKYSPFQVMTYINDRTERVNRRPISRDEIKALFIG